jgi:hypothetical protein
MLLHQETNEYETGDDADPFDGEDDDPNDEKRCNLFQTKADVGNGKSCKVIIDGGSCRNLASKELCSELKLK